MSVAMPLVQHASLAVHFERILVATDFSPVSRRALSYALGIAGRYGSEICIVHAIPPQPLEPIPMDPLPGELNLEQLQAFEKIEVLEDELNLRQVRHKNHIVSGNAVDVIVGTIELEHSDLVILGTHGRGPVKELALGSVAEEVLRVVSCPVLTIGPHVPEPHTEKARFKSVLFATDFGAASARAFSYALFLAEDHSSELVLLHITPPVPYAQAGEFALENCTASRERIYEENLNKLKAMIPAGARLAGEPRCLVESSFLPDGILDTAQMYRCELIVMGANRTRSPRLAAHSPWAVVHEVLREAECPVLTVGLEK